MKLISLKCPYCGAQLQVDDESREAVCDHCGAVLKVDDEVQHVVYDNAEKAGYEFEKGRQRAANESIKNQINYQGGTNQYQVKSPKKSSLIWWILGWIFFFPIPVMILIWRKKNKWKLPVKIAVTIIFWLLVFLFGGSGNNKESSSGVSETTTAAVESSAPNETNSEIETSTVAAETIASVPETTVGPQTPAEFEVVINASADWSENKAAIDIETNLPDETELMLTLSKGDYNTENKWTGQTKVTIKDGKAHSEGFSNKGVKLSGDFDLCISMSLPGLQSDAVRAVIGEHGENMTGSLVEDSSFGDSKVVSQLYSVSMGDSIDIKPEDDYSYTIFASEEEEESEATDNSADVTSDTAANKDFIEKHSSEFIAASSLSLDKFIDKKSYKMSLAPQNWTIAKYDSTDTLIGSTEITYNGVKTTYIYVGTLHMDEKDKVESTLPHYMAIGNMVLTDDGYCDEVFQKLGLK